MIRTVGFQGELGAFSEEAVLGLCPGAEPVPRRTFPDVVHGVVEGEFEAGLLPVENTLAGSVSAAYDALRRGRVRVRGEIVIPIRHFLLGVEGAELDELTEVASHPVALAQCARFLAEHPGIEEVVVYDTAGAAKEVAAGGDPRRAAIASRRAAERWGLRILAEDLQDRPDNQTRFYLVTPEESDDPGEPHGRKSARYKTSLIVELAHEPGALHALLEIFSRRSLNLTHLESRPAESPWTYGFILEYVHDEPGQTREALAEVGRLATGVRVLGVFPAWEREEEGAP